jgi:hypothetical protein
MSNCSIKILILEAQVETIKILEAKNISDYQCIFLRILEVFYGKRQKNYKRFLNYQGSN